MNRQPLSIADLRHFKAAAIRCATRDSENYCCALALATMTPEMFAEIGVPETTTCNCAACVADAKERRGIA